jgi:SM-20-related protein
MKHLSSSIYEHSNSKSDCALDLLAGGIASPGYAHFENLISPDTVAGLVALLAEKAADQELKRAGVGKYAALELRPEIRSDSIFWLDRSDPSPVIKQWLDAMETIIDHFRRALFLPLHSYEGHLARYPEGGFYKPHLDQHRVSPTRQVSIIVYLNDHWNEGDGGELRIFTDPHLGINGPSIDIAPRAGSVVVFRSADFWHEVLPAIVPRRSLTGWFRGRESDPTMV